MCDATLYCVAIVRAGDISKIIREEGLK